ncbi:MAG: hypothetical protein IJ128_06035 [Firmicutes bacterium]|nr:hypothetical protein [Bacillota bacterium]
MRKKVLPILIALVMVLTTGFLPVNTTHAAVNSAKIPKQYQSGYQIYKCIDISNWQGVITKAQFKKLKAKGVTHVIVRVGYTRWASFLRFADASYKKNIDNAYAAGLKVGAYYYSQAKSQKEAKKEAQKTVKLLKNYKSKISLPVAFDWEWGGRLNAKWAKKNGKSANTKICQAFCKEIKASGYKPMIYASSSVLINYLNRDTLHNQYKIWVAHYTGGKATDYSRTMYMWQYSSTAQFGKSLTNTTNVDINYMFVRLSGKWVKASNGKYRYKVGKEYLKSQWLTMDGKKYYLDSNGYRMTGYHKIGNYSYGFSSKGVMYKSTTATIGGKKYKFASNGRSVLYTVKVVNVSDGLAYRTGPSTSSKYKTKGKYKKNYTFDVVRNSSGWYQAGNGTGKGYWSLSKEGGKTYLKKVTKYPQ